jgi:hypothetical protein
MPEEEEEITSFQPHQALQAIVLSMDFKLIIATGKMAGHPSARNSLAPENVSHTSGIFYVSMSPGSASLPACMSPSIFKVMEFASPNLT